MRDYCWFIEHNLSRMYSVHLFYFHTEAQQYPRLLFDAFSLLSRHTRDLHGSSSTFYAYKFSKFGSYFLVETITVI